ANRSNEIALDRFRFDTCSHGQRLMLRAERPDSRSCRMKSSRTSSVSGDYSSLASLGSPLEVPHCSTQQPSNLDLGNSPLAREGCVGQAGMLGCEPHCHAGYSSLECCLTPRK